MSGRRARAAAAYGSPALRRPWQPGPERAYRGREGALDLVGRGDEVDLVQMPQPPGEHVERRRDEVEQEQVVERTLHRVLSGLGQGRHGLAQHLGAHGLARAAGQQRLVERQAIGHELAERAGGGRPVAPLQKRSRLVQEILDQPLGHVGQQGLLVAVVPEEGRLADAGARRDAAYGAPLEGGGPPRGPRGARVFLGRHKTLFPPQLFRMGDDKAGVLVPYASGDKNLPAEGRALRALKAPYPAQKVELLAFVY